MGYGDLPDDGVPQTPLDILHMLREESGDDVPLTIGLEDERILQFCDSDPKLVQTIGKPENDIILYAPEGSIKEE